MPQKLQFDGFKWVKETSQFNEDSINIYNEDSNMRHFFQVDVQYPEVLHEQKYCMKLIMISHFYLKE